MTRTKVHCDICLEKYPLDQFRVLPTCGHGLCVSCTEQTAAQPTCAICRKLKGRKEPIQAFLTLVDPNPLERALNVAEGLGKIGVDAPPESLRKAGGKIRGAVRHLRGSAGEEVAKELLDAARDLDERLSPMFAELKDTNAELMEEVEDLREQLEESEAQMQEIETLKETIVGMEEKHKKIASAAERRKAALATERTENARFSKMLEEQDQVVAAQDAEMEELRAKLERRDNKIALLEKKLKVMSRQAVKRPRPENDDPDESLQIEYSMTEGKSRRRLVIPPVKLDVDIRLAKRRRS
ncbi:Proteophosphoglycan ppg4 [Mycena chlorophos]|uniref:Proteophosphoglycan ppg4 n=1 Tax=Mycena chlorophos TaxID=658473 RepID=A0A8H6WLS0_MYCCL|nr:Proteophosphoglycan ppg4 [Mycena chlorophos]